MKSANRMQFVNPGTRGPIYNEAVKLQEAGENVLKLNTGNPAAFGFEMPDSLKEAIAKASQDSRRAAAYSAGTGMKESKQAILEYDLSKGMKNVALSDIYLGNGVSELAEFTCLALLNPGEEILLPSPNYNLWSNAVILAGGVPVYYECHEEDKWMPRAEEIEALVSDKTRAILVINPNNPTGALYSNELLEKICDVARRHDLVILSDEIYDRLVMDGAVHTSMAKLAPDLPIITYNGLSKSHIVCGLRCGWMTLTGDFGPADGDYRSEFHKHIENLMSVRLCGNTVAQLCIPAALKDPAYTKAMLVPGGRIYDQREACCNAIANSKCLSVVKNTGALYCFVQIRPDVCKVTDDKKWAMNLIKEKHVMVVPGSGFDFKKPNYFRVVMLPYPDDLAKAIRDIDDFCATYKE